MLCYFPCRADARHFPGCGQDPRSEIQRSGATEFNNPNLDLLFFVTSAMVLNLQDYVPDLYASLLPFLPSSANNPLSSNIIFEFSPNMSSFQKRNLYPKYHLKPNRFINNNNVVTKDTGFFNTFESCGYR
jgi:hypothetical protein